MVGRFKGFRALSFLFVGSLVAVGLLLGASGFVIKSRVTQSEDYWAYYQDISSSKEMAISALVSDIGYGGMIHQFKNYVLRKDPAGLQKIRQPIGGAYGSLRAYELAGVNDTEKKALADIRGVINLYAENTELIAQYVSEGKTANQIDGLVKINDNPVIEGIKVLKNQVIAARRSENTADTKTQLIAEIRQAMGFGGMIHQFKNYVLRQDASRIAKVEAKVGEALEGIEKYRKLGMSSGEERALAAIEGVVKSYASNMTLVQGLVRDGMTTEDIDGRVKISDKPAIKGFATLETEVAGQTLAERSHLSENLNTASGFATAIIAITFASFTGLVGFAIWMVWIRMVRPTVAMTQAMLMLADGDTDIEIPGAEKNDEIGDMAKAVEVFRKNSIEAKKLAEEQSTEEARKARRQKHIEKSVARFEQGVTEVLAGFPTQRFRCSPLRRPWPKAPRLRLIM